MSEASKAKQDICLLAKSLYDRGLAHGSTGNISARLSDGSLLVTPTGSSFGFLDPDMVCHLDEGLNQISGNKPTKELVLHQAFYQTRAGAGAVVHLHSHFAVVMSMLPDIDPDDVLPALTPYALMQVGKVKLLPVFMPGDPAMGDAVRGLAGRHSAVLLAHHGPVVAGKNLHAATFAMEELEATAKLAFFTRNCDVPELDPDMIAALKAKFDIDS